MQGMTHEKKDTTVAERWFVGRYRHLQPYPQGNLYSAIRQYMGLSQRKCAALFGVTEQQWRYRERVKRLYHVAEILALADFASLTPEQLYQLLNDVA